MAIKNIYITVESDTGSEQLNITDLVIASLNKKKPSKIEDNEQPIVRVGEGNLTFTTGAISLMNLDLGTDKIEIRYQQIGTDKIPVIGKIATFGIANGSKISGKGSVIYKGNKHDALVEFGTNFILVPSKQTDGLFFMTQDGNYPDIKEIPQPEPEDNDLDELLADDNNINLTLE